MRPEACIIDTNVVVSGLIGADPTSPPARILDAMLDGTLLYLMSDALCDEYSSVLRRPAIAHQHGRTDAEIDRLLAALVANAVWHEPVASSGSPDPGDNHLWALLASYPQARLVTGDQLLIKNPPIGAPVTSPRHFVDTFLSPQEP